jgi:uncharacterized membrane protein YphA (DoxX/SURF4 family)
MFIATAIVSVLLAAVLVMSGRLKLVEDDATLAIMTKVRFPLDRLWLLALAELAGALGLVVGLLWWPIGVAAAIGVILYFLGAIASHLRVHDPRVVPAAVPMLVAVAALVLRAATAG